jgi:hypothetical protein
MKTNTAYEEKNGRYESYDHEAWEAEAAAYDHEAWVAEKRARVAAAHAAGRPIAINQRRGF